MRLNNKLILEGPSGSVATYTVGIFVSLAAYVVPMALLALTRIATRVAAARGHCTARWPANARLHAMRRYALTMRGCAETPALTLPKGEQGWQGMIASMARLQPRRLRHGATKRSRSEDH